MITERGHDTLSDTMPRAHANGSVCGTAHGRGLQLVLRPSHDGSVQATCDCEKAYEAYADVLHGSVVSALLGGAMTNRLFSHERPGVTAELTVRFRHPICIETAATVRARIEHRHPLSHVLEAELVQDGQFKATARGKFMEQPRLAAEE